MGNEFRIKNGLIVSGSADFEQDIRVRGTLTVDEIHTSITSSSIMYESGSTTFGNSEDDHHTFTGSVNITGSINLNGQAIGTGKLNEETFNEYTSSHNVTTSSFHELTSSYNSFTSSYITNSGSFNTRVSNLESFSSSLDTSFVNETEFGSFTGSINTFTASVDGLVNSATASLSASIAITDLNQNSRLSSLENTTGSYATTGSNTFYGLQVVSGSIVPSADNAFSLGSPELNWKDVYISSGSLYIDNTKVLSSTAQELVITTDAGQSIKILEGTTDSIILQSADGNVELKSSGAGDILLDPTNGKILLKGTVEVLNGQKIQSSVNGTPVVFAGDVVVSGSLILTGTIDGVDLSNFSSSVNDKFIAIESGTGSLNSFTSSTNIRLTALETSTGSLNSFTSSTNTKISTLESTTSSLNTYTSSVNTKLGLIETSTGSLNTFSTSANNRLNSLESTTASLNTFTASISSTINNVVNNGTLVSGSSQILITGTTGYNVLSSSISMDITNLSSSVATATNNLSTSLAITDVVQNTRLGLIEIQTGSYATTGSNQFVGNQTVTGSLTITQNLLVLGSSSLLVVTSSQLAVSSSTISVNVFEPAERFGGIKVFDSGSSTATASLLWDSLYDRWIYQNVSGSNYSGAMLITGPRNTGSLGQEVGTISNVVMKGQGGDHITGSNIIDNGTTVIVNSNTVITGSLIVTSTVSGTNITAIESTTGSLNTYTSSNNTRLGVIEGTTSSLNTFTSSTSTKLSNLETASGSIRTDLNTYTSSNNTRLGIIETSTGSLNTFTSSINTTIKSKLNTDGVLSGSSQVLYSGLSGIPSGLVSGSSQVSYGGLSNIPTGIVSGSGQVSYSGLSGIPSGIVSGSSQISFGSLSNIPGGLVSGSVQIDLTATTNYASGIKTRLDAVGVVSGSAQISFGSITGVPSGLVSGSAQITLSSTTGFGTYLNQAVLTSSTPTFFGVKGASYFDAQANSGFRIRNAADNANVGGFTRRGLWEGNTNYDPSIWAETGYGFYIYTNGSATIKTAITPGGSLLVGHTAVPSENAWYGTAVMGRDTYNKVIIGSLNSSTIGAFIGGHNSALTAWADLNIGGLNLIFRYEQTERARFDTSGHFVPGANSTYNLGSASNRWGTIYTSDLDMSNGIGDYTIVEGENDLFLYNNKQNKVYKFMLQEVDPKDATPKMIK